jgi:hypothetical protein
MHWSPLGFAAQLTQAPGWPQLVPLPRQGAVESLCTSAGAESFGPPVSFAPESPLGAVESAPDDEDDESPGPTMNSSPLELPSGKLASSPDPPSPLVSSPHAAASTASMASGTRRRAAFTCLGCGIGPAPSSR